MATLQEKKVGAWSEEVGLVEEVCMSGLGEGGDSRFDKGHIGVVHDSISSLGSIFNFCIFFNSFIKLIKMTFMYFMRIF